MLTLNLDSTVEQELNALACSKNESVEQVITEALRLYAEEQQDLTDLAAIKAREHQPTLSHDEVIERLTADGLL